MLSPDGDGDGDDEVNATAARQDEPPETLFPERVTTIAARRQIDFR
jgi:hypothetical protein